MMFNRFMIAVQNGFDWVREKKIPVILAVVLGALALWALAGCSGSYVELGQYKHLQNQGFDGGEWPTTFVVGQQIRPWLAAECMHVSHISVGAPFNASQEDWFESCGIKLRLEKQ